MAEFVNANVMGRMSIDIEKGTTYEELSRSYCKECKSDILVAKHNNKLEELNYKITEGGKIEFLDLTDEDGMRVYVRGISFLMIKAVKDLLGKDTNVVIEHSIKKNYYCEIREEGVTIDHELLNKIQKRMEELSAMDIPIEKVTLKKEQAVKIFKHFNMIDKVKLIKYRRASNVNLYKIEDFYDYFYGYMVTSTGYLKSFKLEPYENGFLIMLPSRENPDLILEYEHLEKISKVFMEQMHWCQLMDVKNVAELNKCIEKDEFWDLVRVNEALHEKKIAEIADMICEKINDVKVVLISGPSSSGKTTFAKRLCVQLKVNGILPHVISLDDYFINREEVPLDKFGKHDFENIDSLDVELFNSDLNKLILGEVIEMPSYNFLSGKREYKGNLMKLNKGEIFVIEGIHGLNPLLTHNIKDTSKFKIFISAMTQLNVDDHNSISTSDSRLIRRIVRDYKFRGNDAATTIDTWPYVTRGEANNIFPYQENADTIFNSATIYEISILKQFIEPLLFRIDRSQPEYITAKRIIKFLDYFLGADTSNLPINSIIREFVGGSCFHV